MTGGRSSLVVTADDFGLAREVNEAVEIAHRTGILTAASLMVGEEWCADAVARARRMPDLAVGLHLTVVERRPTLPAREIPDLLNPATGMLRTDLARYGAAIAFRPDVRRQLGREMRAQFDAFRRTGLPCAHLDAHKHYHLHPVVAALALRLAREYGIPSIRVPVEPAATLRRVDATAAPGAAARLAGPYAQLLGYRARRAGLLVSDQVFGLAWSGAMTPARVSGLLAHLPPGRTEIFTHPATDGGFDGAAEGYRYAAELEALLGGRRV